MYVLTSRTMGAPNRRRTGPHLSPPQALMVDDFQAGLRAGSLSCAKEPQSTHERLDETLIFRLRLSCARRISSAHFDPAAGCVRYWRQCGCLLFCTRMRAIFSRDVDMTRAIHHRNDRKLLYILLTDVKIGRGSPEQPGASARRVMTSRSCDIATWPV